MYVIDSTNDGAKVPRNKAKNLATPQEENLRSESGGNRRDREKERETDRAVAVADLSWHLKCSKIAKNKVIV